MDDTELITDAEEETSDSAHWYIWTETRQLGPIFFSRLRQMARQGKLSVDAKVKKGKTGEWVRAGDLVGVLFPHPEEIGSTAEQETAAEPDSQAEVAESGLVARAISTIRDRIESLYEEIQLTVSDRLTSFRTIASWLVLLVACGSLSVVLAKHISFPWPFTGGPLATYMSIWDELKEKRKTHASPAEWDAFQAKAERRIKPLVARLERSASTTNRLDQQLLWAGRDGLLKMLSDARTEESPSERLFAEHLQRANWLKEGKDIFGIRRGPATLAPWGIPDEITVSLGIAFVVVDAWIVVALLRRWRKAKHAA